MNFKKEINFSFESKKEMLSFARKSIISYFNGIEGIDEPTFEHKNDKLGVFVTLRKGESLRGCIGSIFVEQPLIQTLKDMAISSASRDPRFYPVDIKEMEEISIEISVLSPFSLVKDIKEIQVGEHGLMIEHKGKRGVFLPEVAVDQSWDISTFLENLCYKAGLAHDILKDNPKIFKFNTIKISDD